MKPSVTPIIITNTTTVIREVEEERMNYIVVIAVVSVIIAIIVIGGIVGYFLLTRKPNKNIVGMDGVNQSSKGEIAGADLSAAKGPGEEVIFEEQYHPKAVVDIFGRGGDIISKANKADDVIIEDDDEDDQSSAAEQPHSTNQENLATNQHVFFTGTKDIAMQEDTHLQPPLSVKQKSTSANDEEARRDYVRRMAASSRLSVHTDGSRNPQ
jgi:hypothetical protein